MASAPITVEDFRELAEKRLPRIVFDYLEGGADDESALTRNRCAFDRYRFVPQRFVDVSSRSLETSIFGHTHAMPLVVAPTGLNGLFWPHGDIELAKAAARADIPFVLSTASNESIEDVARHCDGDKWFQLYVVHADLAQSLVSRAHEAGYSTLVLTVDVGVNGNRERDRRNRFGVPITYTPRMILDGITHPQWSVNFLRHGVPELANFRDANRFGTEVQAALLQRKMDTSFDWERLARLRDQWSGRLIVKGILNPAEISRCVTVGVDGVILSNHGGRQLDCAVAPMEVLTDCVAESGGSPVFVDSGFRRGSDVVKALALGAQAVLLGRATLYGLAARGGLGVDGVLQILRSEIDGTLAQIGCASINELSPEFLLPA